MKEIKYQQKYVRQLEIKKGGTVTCFTRPDGRRLIGMHSGTYCVTLCGACRTCEGSS